jgi:hypothetical protein
MKQLLLIPPAILALTSISSAQVKDNILDFNYSVSYKNALNLRWSSVLTESTDWKLRGFTAGSAYNITHKNEQLLFVYDVTRGNDLNAPMNFRYGLEYKTNNPLTNLSFSLYQLENQQFNGISAKIDLKTKF